MKDLEDTPIDGQMDFVSFKEIVEEITSAKFEDIFESLVYGDKNESELA